MAIYHLSVKAISRSAGRSATAAAAYRSAERIVDVRTGEIFDFTKKSGVEVAEIAMPPGSDWTPTREELWNAAEAAERRRDACTAREHEVALPRELTAAQRLALARAYASDLAERHGCAVDLAIHQPRPDAGEGQENWHVHILQTTRVVDGQGLGEKCARERAGRNRKEDLKTERARWEQFCNAALAEAGAAARVDHRSLVDQQAAAVAAGEPEKARQLARPASRHRGPAEDAMRRKGRRTRRGAERQAQAREHASASAEAGTLGHEIARAADELREMRRRQRRAEARKRRIGHEPNRMHGQDRPAALVSWLSREKRQGTTVYRWPNGSAAVIDRGNCLSFPATTDARLEAGARLAKEKGWESVKLSGGMDFKRRAAAALVREGLAVSNPELQDYIQQLQQQHREAPAAPPVPPAAPQAPQEVDPWRLGEQARAAGQEIRLQETAGQKAERPALEEKAQQIKAEQQRQKGKIMEIEDSFVMREAFAASQVAPLHRQAIEQDHIAAGAQSKLASIQSSSLLSRLSRWRAAAAAAEEVESAKRKAALLREKADKIEAACMSMTSPKVRGAYQEWMNKRRERLEAEAREAGRRLAAIDKAKREARQQAGYKPERLEEAKASLAQVEQAAAKLPPDQRDEFESARAGMSRERLEQARREALEKQRRKDQNQQQDQQPARPRPRSPGM